MKKAFYLKINREEEFAYRNIERWIELSQLFTAECFILCDKQAIIDEIIKRNILLGKVVFISSDRRIENKKLATSITEDDKWCNAALAHMTTFYHAVSCGYSHFWNIDADDTFLCLSVERIREVLERCEDYAETYGIDGFSLDMWRTLSGGKHWSFGITYISTRRDWQNLMKEHCDDLGYQNKKASERLNIDWFFTYLKGVEKTLKLETFCVNNLKFIHYSADPIYDPINSAFYHWKDGKLILPIVEFCFDMKQLGILDIAEDVIPIDININGEEALSVLAFYNRDWKILDNKAVRLVNEKYMVSNEIAVMKRKRYILSCVKHPTVVLFGAGSCYWHNYKQLEKDYGAKYVCDNDAAKWGKMLGDLECISPKRLIEIENVFVIITVNDRACSAEIQEQLCQLGIVQSAYLYGEEFMAWHNII